MARPAAGFTISTVVTEGCHERMTTDALRAVRAMFDTAAPIPASRNDRALIADLQFTPAPDMTDLGGATLLVGVRDNDLLGRDPTDLTQLAIVHGDPTLQQLHCLHPVHSPEPGGSVQALADCRSFIVEHVAEALTGLDATGRPDPTLLTPLRVHLAIRHRVTATLPTYYVRIGQAIHAVEDIFSHSYRTPDQSEVTAVMNWVDEVEHDLNEATDGPPHSSEMDRCDDPDDFRRTRRLLATEAATAMLQITLDPTLSPEQKSSQVAAHVDTWLAYSSGCTFANGWCGAPERDYGNVKLLSCDVGPQPASSGFGAAALALATLAAWARGRRRRTFAVALVLVTALARSARADGAPPNAAAAAAHVPPPRTTPVPEPGPHDRSRPTFGLYLGAAGSATDPALAMQLGARLRVSLHWTFGLDAEWNPWLAVNGANSFRAGTFNGYATAIFRMPLAYERINLRVTGSAGASLLLTDLYGVADGSTGIFAAVYPLGIEWKASRLFYVILNPLGFAAPIPQLTNIPFWFPQYRVSLGIEIYGS
jgi:hypothetical protein